MWGNRCPQPVAEYRFHDKRRYRFDFAFPEHKVAVEIEGGIYMRRGGHSTGGGITRDIEKGNLAVSEGWRVLRFTGPMLNRQPDECIDLVAGVLSHA